MARPSIPLKQKFQLFLYRLCTLIFDALDDRLSSNIGTEDKKIEDRPLESEEWSDEEILQRYGTMPSVEEVNGEVGAPYVVRICSDTAVKHGWTSDDGVCSEVLAIELIRSQTSISTPRIQRTIKDGSEFLIVMEYIDGRQLSRCWPDLSIWGKIKVACTLRGYIRQLRHMHDELSLIPGPLGPQPYSCTGHIFADNDKGPFPDYSSLSAYFNLKLRQSQGPRGAAIPDSDPFDDSKSLVFTHNDLNMRNIMLDRDGRVWMVDWAWSGYFPKWFEYMAMAYAAD